MTPHVISAHDGPVELLTIFDHDGERAHLHATDEGASTGVSLGWPEPTKPWGSNAPTIAEPSGNTRGPPMIGGS